MTLTDIISKVTRYAKKIIVTDNGSTSAASISQAGTGDGLSITGTTGIGASVTTTTGTTLKLQQNNPNPVLGGTLEVFPPAGGDFIYNGGTDGIFAFVNTSTAATKATVFSGANVGIGTTSPNQLLTVNGSIQLGPSGLFKYISTNSEHLAFTKKNGAENFYFRITDTGDILGGNPVDLMTIRNNGNVGIGTATPAKTLHVNGTVRLQGIPTFATNAAAIAGGLVADDVYKIAAGELRIVV